MTTRRNSILRQLVPIKVKHLIMRSRLYIKDKSTSVNIYHCCVQKTGSQWIRAILSDSRTFRYSGLKPYMYELTLPGGYDPRKLTDRSLAVPFPQGTIVTPLYIDFANFLNMPKPQDYKAFFVMRDPRDIVVSWYFSARYSHTPISRLSEIRQLLECMPVRDGILYSIDHLANYGLFAALRSWASAPETDPNVLLLRFEEMSGANSFHVFSRLFSECDIAMPDKHLKQLIQEYSFERLSGRRQGEEDIFSQYRKGIPGDWRNHFDDIVIEKFKETTGDLVVCLGYEERADW